MPGAAGEGGVAVWQAGGRTGVDGKGIHLLLRCDTGCCQACFCAPCTACTLRQSVLQNQLEFYRCCQGYHSADCNECVEELGCAPKCLLCCEVSCCLCGAVVGTRQFLSDAAQLQPDRCDNRIMVSRVSTDCGKVSWLTALLFSSFHLAFFVLLCFNLCSALSASYRALAVSPTAH